MANSEPDSSANYQKSMIYQAKRDILTHKKIVISSQIKLGKS